MSAAGFEGEKTTWHEGFARYDFVMDDHTLAITPYHAPDGEKFGLRPAPEGQVRCVVIVPKSAAAGNPWSWRGCYWDHQPQTEIELLRRGFHIAYVNCKPGKEWEGWYDFLTVQHDLSRKPAFVGMSRGGEYAYIWSTTHPDKVACIYADNPGSNPEIFARLRDLATNDIPVLHVCGSIDPILGKNTLAMESMYQNYGGRISLMIKDGAAHHPHSLRDPTLIADFIVQSVGEKAPVKPAFVTEKFTRTVYYGVEDSYREFPKEHAYITCRGPLFTDTYERYEFQVPEVKGTINVIAPKTPAEGHPWVWRADFVQRTAAVDLALLGRGFYIVTGPVSFDADEVQPQDWNTVYQYLTDRGFSKKPVMEGDGGAAKVVYDWAIANPEKVSCIYAENPILRQTLDHLEPLAKAGVPLLDVCGSLDPSLDGQTRVSEARYHGMGGAITVMVKPGVGHFPLAPLDPQPVVAFIVQAAK